MEIYDNKECYYIVQENGEAFKVVDDNEKYVEELKKQGIKSFEAFKIGKIIAREGIVGEQIETYTNTGLLETTNIVKSENIDGVERPGYVVTKVDENGNPIYDEFGHTNTWIVPASTFEKKYNKTEEPGVYEPEQTTQEFIQVNENIVIKSTRGEDRYFKEGSFLNISNPEKIYGIAKNEFEESYKRGGQTLTFNEAIARREKQLADAKASQNSFGTTDNQTTGNQTTAEKERIRTEREVEMCEKERDKEWKKEFERTKTFGEKVIELEQMAAREKKQSDYEWYDQDRYCHTR